jgi:Fe-S-cluster formation regulator IscX/YfhJ
MEDNFSKWQTREGIKNLPEFDEDPGAGGEPGTSTA